MLCVHIGEIELDADDHLRGISIRISARVANVTFASGFSSGQRGATGSL